MHDIMNCNVSNKLSKYERDETVHRLKIFIIAHCLARIYMLFNVKLLIRKHDQVNHIYIYIYIYECPLLRLHDLPSIM